MPPSPPLEITAELAADVWARLEERARQRQCAPAVLIAEAVAHYFSPEGAGRHAVAVTTEPSDDLWATAPKLPRRAP